MKRIKWILSIATSMILVGCVGSYYTFPEQVHSRTPLDRFSVQAEFAEREVGALKVGVSSDLNVSSIEMKPTNGQMVRVELDGVNLEGHLLSIDSKFENDTLIITPVKSDIQEDHTNAGIWLRLFNRVNDDNDLHLIVFLPKKTYRALDLELINGMVKVEEVSSERLNIQVENGRIDLSDLRSRSTELVMNNGEMMMRSVDGDVLANLANGSIQVDTEDLERNLDLNVQNGEIEIQSEKEPLNIRSSVVINQGVLDWFGQKEVQSVYGDGRHQIKLRLNVGKIKVN